MVVLNTITQALSSTFHSSNILLNIKLRLCGDDGMVVGFITTYAINAYHC
jgi:hypothetical protein